MIFLVNCSYSTRFSSFFPLRLVFKEFSRFYGISPNLLKKFKLISSLSWNFISFKADNHLLLLHSRLYARQSWVRCAPSKRKFAFLLFSFELRCSTHSVSNERNFLFFRFHSFYSIMLSIANLLNEYTLKISFTRCSIFFCFHLSVLGFCLRILVESIPCTQDKKKHNSIKIPTGTYAKKRWKPYSWSVKFWLYSPIHSRRTNKTNKYNWRMIFINGFKLTVQRQ